MNDNLTGALKYCKRGWSVLPIHYIKNGNCSCKKSECPSPGKHPLILNGSKGAVSDKEQIIKWWKENPSANVGIATGQISGLVVLDIDPDKGGEQSFENIIYKHSNFPETIQVFTGGGGIHYYFQYPNSETSIRNKVSLFPGIDVRGKGGYVVAPPSNYKSGDVYMFEASSSPDDLDPAPLPQWLLEMVSTKNIPVIQSSDKDMIPEGRRNDTLFRIASAMRRQGLDEEAIKSALLAQNKHCVPPLYEEEVNQIAKSAVRYKPKAELAKYSNSDRGNAERFSLLFGDEVRYCAERNTWYIWDSTKWAPDKSLKIYQYARNTIDHMYEAGLELEDEKRAKFIKYVTNIEALHRTEAMIKYAKSEKGISITQEELDREPFLLNTETGTIDLTTGELREHNPRDLITKSVGYPFNESAECPRFKQFLKEVIDDEKVIEFLQTAIGWTLTGVQQEQKMIILHGIGNNGKTTFVNTILRLLGDYGCQTPVDTLLIRRNDGIPNDIARLDGMRLVTAMESQKDRRLNEALIKQLTGGDPISARFLHQEYFDFIPAFKIWLMTNHVPLIREVGIAMWRRLLKVPFNKQISENKRDMILSIKLEKELPGILTWAIEGCLKWQKSGLIIPESIKESTRQLRDEMDTLKEFIDEHCETGQHYETKTADLYVAYTQWCDDTGEKHVSQKKLGIELGERGYKQGRSNKVRIWKGIAPKGRPSLKI